MKPLSSEVIEALMPVIWMLTGFVGCFIMLIVLTALGF
jgi:hypothetical protein